MEILQQSPLDDAFVQNPYATYHEVFAGRTIRYWQEYDMLCVFDARRVSRLLRDRRLGRALPADQNFDPPPHLKAFYAIEQNSMLELEPPKHTRLRGLVLRAFTSRRIRDLEPDIHAICNDLLRRVPRGEFDLLETYCTPLPVRIIARLLGVPEAMSPDLLRWSHAMVAMYMAGKSRREEDAANDAAQEFSEFLTGYIEKRRTQPQDDLITHLIAAEEDGEKLSRDEMISTCILLLNAGHEATVHTLGNAVKTLLEHGMAADATKPSHIYATVEEVLRFDPPLHMFTRYVYEDMDLDGHLLPKGAQIGLMLGAAGHDPELCADPDTFDPFRPAVPHVAFGGGLHFCVGAPLARLELQIGLQSLFTQLPDLSLAELPRYSNSYHFHGLERLLVSAQ